MDLPASTNTEEARRVFCVYPVSGNYTSFQRNLFYITTALALLGHAHEWLTAACLAFAVSYSSTAAIYALALAFFQGGDSLLHHDGDIIAVDVVVNWALYASLVCALFCPRLLDRNLDVLVGAWCLLLAAAHLALVFSSPRLMRGIAASLVLSRRDEGGRWSDPCAGMEVRTAFRGYPGDSMSAVVLDSVRVNHASLPQSPSAEADIIRRPEDIRATDIVVFIVLQSLKNSLMIAPSLQLLGVDRRASRNGVFVRLLAKRVPYPPSRRRGSNFIPASVIVRFMQLYRFLLHCFPFLMVVDFPIRLVARTVFQCFGIRKLRIEDISYLEPEISQRRYQAAKYTALLYYILTTLGYVTWIAAVASFATGETTRFLASIPESETFRAVGQWSSWLTLSLAIATTLASRLSGTDQMKPMDTWIQQHRSRLLYARVRDWLAAEWRETKEWWSNPEKQAIASLLAGEQDYDTENSFARRMILALEAFSTHQTGFLLPPPRASQLDEQLRGQYGLPFHGINVAEPITTNNTTRKGKVKERQA